jgi:TetR/AcrR family transcriptional regulator, cholesterol catabolism regulator
MPPVASSTNKTRRRRPGQKRELSRDEILRVAARLFRDKGYRATNLQEVADYFGVRRPAIYYYFSNKVEILLEIHNRLLNTLMAQLEEISAMDISPDEKLRRAMLGQVEVYAENISELAVFIGNEAELPAKEGAQARKEKRRYEEMLEQIYRDGVADGTFVDLDPQITMFTLTGMTSWMYRWYKPGGRYSAAEIAESIVSLARGGYVKP